jgi:hypothetical protein
MYNFFVSKKPEPYLKPDKRFNYCNTNYALLALLIEKITKNTFSDFLQKEFFKPLGMKHTATINEIDLNGFNNTYFKEIRLSIPNMSIEMMRILNYSLNPNFAYKHWVYQYYNSIYIENRQNIDCFKMLFLIKFKVYYNFINDNVDIHDVTTSDCMNLTKVRETLNRYNDTFHHINYIPIVIPPTDHLTYQKDLH